MTEAVAYAKHLYADDLDGYLQMIHFPNGKQGVKWEYMTGARVLGSLREREGQADWCITPNSFYKPERLNRNIRHFRALYTDLDLYKTNYGKMEAVYEVMLLSEEGIIPRPTMFVDSGRGLHLYWRINHAPVGAAWTWQELQDYLYRQLRHLGADIMATDSARPLRIPGTINGKNGAFCRLVEVTDDIYSMYDLREEYLNWGSPKNQGRKGEQGKGKGKGTVSHIRKPYTLHMARLSDLLTLCRLRRYDVYGYRNHILHLFAYWQGITLRDPDGLAGAVSELNNSFQEPLKPTEINDILRSVPRAIEAFLNPEKVSTARHDPEKGPPGYNYSNETLIEMLDITDREQQQLKTIIGKEEKYRRNNERRTPRNEAGLTPREQQKLDTVTTIKELRAQGLTVRQIAEEVGLTIKGVEYHLYSKNKDTLVKCSL